MRLAEFLDRKVLEFNQPSFIAADPISVPHLFSKKQDIEIAGFFAAIFAWGIRTTIINKGKELMRLMDLSPHDFIINHTPADLKPLLSFKHRTFNTTDLLYFIEFLQYHYQRQNSLESAFLKVTNEDNQGPFMESALNHFHNYFFSLDDIPNRTKKHIASPYKNSTCKRLNMYLRWMVRSDSQGVDFGLWKKIKPADLICPVDLHVARVAKRFHLLDRAQVDWLAAKELTNALKLLDPQDPVKYDFALFSLGAMEKF